MFAPTRYKSADSVAIYKLIKRSHGVYRMRVLLTAESSIMKKCKTYKCTTRIRLRVLSNVGSTLSNNREFFLHKVSLKRNYSR